MKRLLVPGVLAFGLWSACSSEPELNNQLLLTHTPLVQQIFYTDDSLFHGITLGMNPDQVKALLAPGDSITEEHENYLLIEGRFDEKKYYTWECEFDTGGLYALSLDVYLTDEPAATDWLIDITSYFTDRFGPATDDGIALTWEVKNTARPARIELSESTEYSYGKLQVYYYDLSFIPLQNDTIPQDSVFLPSDALQ